MGNTALNPVSTCPECGAKGVYVFMGWENGKTVKKCQKCGFEQRKKMERYRSNNRVCRLCGKTSSIVQRNLNRNYCGACKKKRGIQ